MRMIAATDSASVKSLRSEAQAQLLPSVLQDKLHLFVAELFEVVDETNPGVELRVACQALFDARHAD